jgi:hypothetical protein
MTDETTPEAAEPSQEPPEGLGYKGAQLWRQTSDGLVLDAVELGQLEQACRLQDRVTDLEVLVDDDGLQVAGSMGQTRLHPAVVEIRQAREAIGRLLARIRVPDSDEGSASRSSQGREAALNRWRPPAPADITLRRGPRGA